MSLVKKMTLKTVSLITFSTILGVSSTHADNSSQQLRNTIVDTQRVISSQAYNPENNRLEGISAWINKSEVNWGSDDLGNLDDHKLSYEIGLKNREQLRTEQELLNLSQKQSQLKLSTYLEKKLFQRYLSLIDLMSEQNQRRYLQQKHALANSELNNWKLKINGDDFRADKLQQADLTLDNVWGEMLENGGSIEQLRGSSGIRQLEKTLSIHHMLATTNRILKTGEYKKNNGSIKQADMDIRYAAKQAQRNSAKQKLSLNSFKLDYDKNDDDFGVSLGVRIPLSQNSYERLQEKQRLHYAGLEAQNIRLKIAEQLREKQNQLRLLSHQWQSMIKVENKINARITRLSSSTNLDLIFDLKGHLLEVQKRKERTKTQALREYIGFLNKAEMLSAKPYRNWILVRNPRLF